MSIASDDPVLPGRKYRGRRVSDILREDPGYLHWMVNNLQLPAGLREQIEAGLKQIGFDPEADHQPFPVCPPSGNAQVHSWWLPAAAGWCKRHGLSRGEAIDKLHAVISRPVHPRNEIESCVARIYEDGATGGRSSRPKPNASRRDKVLQKSSSSLKSLIELSPVSFAPENREAAEQIVTALFVEPDNPDPWIWCGIAQNKGSCELLSDWKSKYSKSFARARLVVPNPFRSKIGTNQDGDPSQRALSNIVRRNFFVAEQDKGTHDQQAAIILELAKLARLCLVVDSAGVSLHAWFFLGGLPTEKAEEFMNAAVALGCDAAMCSAHQPARMPHNRRDNGFVQRVLYFDPKAKASAEETLSTSAEPAPQEEPSATESFNAKDAKDVAPAVSKTLLEPAGTSTSNTNIPDSVAHTAAFELPTDLPERVRAVLETAPPCGKAILLWIRPAARSLLAQGYAPKDVAAFLFLIITLNHPHLTGEEIMLLHSRSTSAHQYL